MQVAPGRKEHIADRTFACLGEGRLKTVGRCIALEKVRAVTMTGKDNLLEVGELILVGGQGIKDMVKYREGGDASEDSVQPPRRL